MTNKKKFLLSLFIFALLLVLYFFIAPESNLIKNEEKVDNTSLELRNDYKDKASLILADYSVLIKNEEVIITEIEQVKSRLLGLKVPKEFKDLHLDLVFAFAKMENYLSESNEQEKVESEQIINQIKANYGWLR